jgi:hypothetical protein
MGQTSGCATAVTLTVCEVLIVCQADSSSDTLKSLEKAIHEPSEGFNKVNVLRGTCIKITNLGSELQAEINLNISHSFLHGMPRISEASRSSPGFV